MVAERPGPSYTHTGAEEARSDSAREGEGMKQADLEARIRTLEDIEEIKRLKCRYWRCLDRKLWAEMEECFARRATADYGPSFRFRGRKSIVAFLRQFLGRDSVTTFHMGHNAEIEMTGEGRARGRWVLNDFFIVEPGTKRRGWGFYDDEYVKEDGQWKKKSTRLTTQFEEWEPPRGGKE